MWLWKLSSTGNRFLVFPLGRQMTFEEPRNVILISNLACTTLLGARPHFQQRTLFSWAKLPLEVPSLSVHHSSDHLSCSQCTYPQHVCSLCCYVFLLTPLFCHLDVVRPHHLLPFVGWELHKVKKPLGREHGGSVGHKAVPGK